jgi:hypothetical protein
MDDDISQSVSQGGYGAYDEENRRIQEISNELQRVPRNVLIDVDGDVYVVDAEIKKADK